MRQELKEQLLKGVVTIILCTSVFFAARQAAVLVNEGTAQKTEQFCVVIDAGHGGDDPGKIGINGALEKEVNMQIAEKLKMFLEASDVKVVMTRESDGGLYDENASNKKVQDMKRRIQIIEEAQPNLAVSIHQNSYGEEYVNGAQVFYYNGSVKSKELAEMIQNRMIQYLDPENHRQAKANDSYYLLKKRENRLLSWSAVFCPTARRLRSFVIIIIRRRWPGIFICRSCSILIRGRNNL